MFEKPALCGNVYRYLLWGAFVSEPTFVYNCRGTDAVSKKFAPRSEGTQTNPKEAFMRYRGASRPLRSIRTLRSALLRVRDHR
jgi:hypothetical protein